MAKLNLSWIALVICASVLLTSCGDSARTAEQFKRDYALKILEGFSVGYYDIRAERADPNSYVLYDLSLQSGEALIHADSAHIIVDARDNTIALKLIGVTGADAKSGALIELHDLRTDGVKIAGGVRD